MVDGVRHFEVIEDECVGCNLCVNVCPVENCITMVPLAAGVIDQRTEQPVSPVYANWTQHPNNPMAKAGGGVGFLAAGRGGRVVYWLPGAVFPFVAARALLNAASARIALG